MYDRYDRIAEEIKRELSNVIRELKDPRIGGVVSVVAVDVTKDLRYAKAYISVLGSDEEKENALSGLKSAAGFIRREIGNRVMLRHVPEFHFVIDNSIEHGINISKLIDEVRKKDEESK
ncbi:MAG: 30S ribosome-binding factor RbfA [Clostridiaceae bacterium]|nr:30S ribosome-binding factor RbfA [Clostridiaceae bacterium]